MRYDFLIDTYESEALKILGVWSMFDDSDLRRRPHAEDTRGRHQLEHMVHQCVSEDAWFQRMLGIRVSDHPLPQSETRMEFLRVYARDSSLRLAALREQSVPWWEEEVT